MIHAKLLEWEKRLTQLFNEVDDYLEDNYGDLYILHPARPERGSTSNKSQDGLFNVGAAFSAGLGSEYGPGYVIEVRFATLENVPEPVKAQISEEVVNMVKERLPRFFPENKLHVARDGNIYKIYGDLKLGNV